jgi:hypothetical protein
MAVSILPYMAFNDARFLAKRPTSSLNCFESSNDSLKLFMVKDRFGKTCSLILNARLNPVTPIHKRRLMNKFLASLFTCSW